MGTGVTFGFELAIGKNKVKQKMPSSVFKLLTFKEI